MYKGFNVKLTDSLEEKDYYYGKGLEYYKKYDVSVKKTLKELIDNDGIIDGSKMQEDWFPLVNSLVFISHSHTNRDLAITFSGWLKEEFGINAFIDSCIWGYADNLLKILDDKYCFNPKTNTYDYKSRNFSTSHIHMMLSSALTKMMDKAECLFFINTPDSISSTQMMVNHTESPWIYAEINMFQLIRKITPLRHKSKELEKSFSDGGILENIRIKYQLDLSNLVELSENSLNEWFKQNNSKNQYKSIDTLYRLFPYKKELNG